MPWVTIEGRHVFIGEDGTAFHGKAALDAAKAEGQHEKPTGKKSGAAKSSSGVHEEKPSAKAQRAQSSAKRVDGEVQRYSEEHTEPKIAKSLKGVSFPDSEPVDIVIGDKSGVVSHGIELKTMTIGQNEKLTMNSYAQVRKVNWERANKATFHTVVVDDRKVFNAKGPGLHDESQRQFFYRRGIAGSARVGAMEQVKTLTEVKALMAMPETQLPKGAQRTDAKMRIGTWKSFADSAGKGFKNSKTGAVVRPKK